MKLFRSTCIRGVALSLVAVAAAYGGEESEPARAESGDCPCCESTTHCPVLRAAETKVTTTPACGKSLSCPGMHTGSVKPRIIIQEEEESLLVLEAPAAPDACNGTKCSSAATACKGKSGEIAKTHQIEIELELGCGAKTCGKSGACESQCQAGCEKSACCEAASTKTACSKTKCSSATAKHCTDCDDEELAAQDASAAAGHCGEDCACADKCQCTKSKQAGNCCAERAADKPTTDCPTRHFSQQTEQTSKALAELMERLGPSLIEGTEFERVPSYEAPTPESFDRPVSIREELVDYIRCLAAGEEPSEEVEAEVICTDNDSQDSIGPTERERMDAVNSLREAALVLEQTAAQLEQNNLYDASDRTRELANQLRLKGRHLKMFDAETVKMQAEPATVQEWMSTRSGSKPVSRKPLIYGGV